MILSLGKPILAILFVFTVPCIIIFAYLLSLIVKDN